VHFESDFNILLYHFSVDVSKNTAFFRKPYGIRDQEYLRLKVITSFIKDTG